MVSSPEVAPGTNDNSEDLPISESRSPSCPVTDGVLPSQTPSEKDCEVNDSLTTHHFSGYCNSFLTFHLLKFFFFVNVFNVLHGI